MVNRSGHSSSDIDIQTWYDYFRNLYNKSYDNNDSSFLNSVEDEINNFVNFSALAEFFVDFIRFTAKDLLKSVSEKYTGCLIN